MMAKKSWLGDPRIVGRLGVDFYEEVDQVVDLLMRRKRVAYRALQRQFDFDDDDIAALKDELIDAQRIATDEADKVLVWAEESTSISPPGTSPEVQPVDQSSAISAYPPSHLDEQILQSKSALEGERKQVTVLFADIKGSTELIRDLDPEDAQKLLDPAIHKMMVAVHRFEGTVNQILGDGTMSIFGAPTLTKTMRHGPAMRRSRCNRR